MSTSLTRSQQGQRPSSLSVLGQTYASDDYTNLPSSILSRLAPSPTLPYQPHHPLCLLRAQIEEQLGAAYTPIRAPSPVVSTHLNFEELGFPVDHPGRSPTDTYYLNRTTCLRTHTSAHEVETFRNRHDRWLLTADVYRRDEIDASHYPIFHQMEGAAIFPTSAYAPGGQVELECQEMEARLARANLEIEDTVDLDEAGGFQPTHDARSAQLACRHLKATLNGLVLDLFGERHAQEPSSSNGGGGGDPLRVRWIAATFPFTSPSFEVEVWFRGKWLEILGCGVVMENTLTKAGVNAVGGGGEKKMGWAFGLGLERIAMVLYSIPDIRLFWSQDRRFLDQFIVDPASDRGKRQEGFRDTIDGGGGGGKDETGVSAAGGAQSPTRTPRRKLVTFKPYSKYPPCYKDVSFWLPSSSSSACSQGSTATTITGGTRFHENDFYEIVRDTVADLAEDVVKIDEFTHPKTGRASLCYRINYRSMDR
ncbi:related to MSF1 - phenylalanine--tRNA ligase alpha chain, mitochondrial [Pseudozyma flocculosa]|nr:related to MSF1 - phenylalanine--tRNA ligase alpha chain, mitochondrial [Pseudozyma flocculosa]